MNDTLNVSAQHYQRAHLWARATIKKPKKCVRCNEEKPLDLSNNSGFYLLEESDWEPICRRCHVLKDGLGQNLVILNKQRTTLTEAHKKNIGLANAIALKGNIPWNRDKFGYTTKPSSDIKKQRISQANKGQVPWNKNKHGVQEYSNERMEKLWSARRGKPSWNKGLKFTS